MAKTKAKGSTKYGRDSIAKRLGVKLYAGEKAKTGSVLIRQRGSKFYPGKNVKKGSDDTLYATASGRVVFSRKVRKKFTGKKRIVSVVSIEPEK